MKITFVISSLEAGGAQRVMCTMANYWAKKGWKVTLITMSGLGNDFYSFETNIKRIGLNSLAASENRIQAIYSNLKRLCTLRKSVKNASPDVIISFMDRMNVMTLVATSGLNVPVLISERTDPRQHNIGRLWSSLRDKVYPRATKLIVQSESVQQWAIKLWPKLPGTVIHNPVSIPLKKAIPELLDPAYKWFIGMGRLIELKQFDILLQAFSELAGQGTKHWRLIILGEGEQREALEKQIEELGLTGKVLMPGNVENPSDYLYQADIFVMSSRYEGFPNALLEAMACGLPVISTDCPSGPAEIIHQNVNGVLVEAESKTALTNAMYRLMQSQELRQQLSENAIKSSSRFEVGRIMKQWEEAIEEATKKVS